jgi:nucleoside-diphosphate-sugar epimerase
VRVALAGACAALDRCGPALAANGHDVVRLPSSGALARALEGCDALVNLASGRAEASSRAADLVRAAREAGVRRFVQRSVSLMYADQGPEWITERSPLCVTSLTEPASMDEVAVQSFVSPCRDGVVLRMGMVLGDPGSTRSWLRSVARRRSSGARDDGFAHLLHVDDVASAVHAALDAPSGIYNVGAAPVRRAELWESCLSSLGRRAMGSVIRPGLPGWRGRQLEPLSRSLRVSSSAFMGTTGWAPRRDAFDASWLQSALTPPLALR